MKIIGIGGSNHDFSAALLVDGEIVVAIEDERINRIKHGSKAWDSLPAKASVDYCLQACNLKMEDIDYIFSTVDLEMPSYSWAGNKLKTLPHHLNHAACAFYPSPFESAGIMVVDGHGGLVSKPNQEFETMSLGQGSKNKVHIKNHQKGRKKISSASWRYMCENSLGVFYTIISEGIGFSNRGQGKTMGLAPYGDLSLYPELSEFVSFKDDRFFFDPYNGIYDWIVKKLRDKGNEFKRKADIACAAQKIFEETVLALANVCYKMTGQKYLTYGGGCALNGSANYRLLKESQFEDLFIYPAAGDNGLAIGAAYYGYHHIKGKSRTPTSVSSIGKIPCKGRVYSKEETQKALKSHPVQFMIPDDPVKEIAHRIKAKEVVAIFNGRSEIGPRALGNRSILADPSTTAMRDYINLSVKFRESFRPLAPIVPIEHADEYFELDKPAPFMLTIANVKKKYLRNLAGICHIDQTARCQTVDKESKPFLYKLLMYYGEITGHPILINTSFNVKGEPIVETPYDALNCFAGTNIHTLYLDGYIVEKHTPWMKRAEPIL